MENLVKRYQVIFANGDMQFYHGVSAENVRSTLELAGEVVVSVICTENLPEDMLQNV